MCLLIIIIIIIIIMSSSTGGGRGEDQRFETRVFSPTKNLRNNSVRKYSSHQYMSVELDRRKRRAW